MKRLLQYLLLINLFLINTLTLADTSANQQLATLLSNMYSIQGQFKQVVTNAKGKILQTSTGTMIMQRPNKFRWEIKSPNPQLVVSDGKNLWVYNKSLQQVSVQPLKKNLAATPALLLDATPGRIQRYFTITQQGNWFYLTAKDSNSMFSKISLQFNGNILKQMQLVDNLGQSGTLQFIALHVNAPVASDAFTFTPPKNVDVVGQT